jgi:HYDIN/CFA65/VesB family protein
VLLREVPLLVLLFSLTGQFNLASGAPDLRADAPEAVVDITRRDLGEVFAGEELEYAFIVRNTGRKPLELAEKTTASSRSAPSGYTPSLAMWRPGDGLFTQPVAFMLTASRRAAPT